MFILNQHNSIANQFLLELRDVQKQEDRLRFRNNLERLGEILAYEISKKLIYKSQTISTPLKNTSVQTLSEQPVLISILRAAIPFFQGFINYFDQADSGFIGAIRKSSESNPEISVDLNYLAAPLVEDKEVIIVDPMLATGKSLLAGLNELRKNGKPKKVHIASVIAAPEGIDYIRNNLDIPYQFWTCALDEKLNPKAYIVPGLGDAGDLSFGPKM
ncbi:uracil phosphoribosyltransferase [Echinicola jeungdonensis]|uniref:Uracil phosphoribosyltransferase n=1 Tax=Echinicola jeungdonensis TaxID=709343 RepID=A0ABV5J2H4_9BACT|nr:uracil phosphoribosyltransferase [Echinicola jeungdonensis]MDN3668557.1 uracil phosphoribosyltransferase [Echinicola jeungdonensis]